MDLFLLLFNHSAWIVPGLGSENILVQRLNGGSAAVRTGNSRFHLESDAEENEE